MTVELGALDATTPAKLLLRTAHTGCPAPSSKVRVTLESFGSQKQMLQSRFNVVCKASVSEPVGCVAGVVASKCVTVPASGLKALIARNVGLRCLNAGMGSNAPVG